MNLKEQLIKEIDQIPEPLLSQLLDYALFIKARYRSDEITEEERATIAVSKLDYEAGDYTTLKQSEQPLSSNSTTAQPRTKTQVKALQRWFNKTELVPADFDADEAKWEALKEKYNL